MSGVAVLEHRGNRLRYLVNNGTGVVSVSNDISRRSALALINTVILKYPSEYWQVFDRADLGADGILAVNGTAIAACVVGDDVGKVRLFLLSRVASAEVSTAAAAVQHATLLRPAAIPPQMTAACINDTRAAARLLAEDPRRPLQYALLGGAHFKLPLLLGAGPLQPPAALLTSAVGFAPDEQPADDQGYDVVVVRGDVARFQRGVQAELRPALRLDDGLPPAFAVQAQLSLADGHGACWLELSARDATHWVAANMRRLVSYQPPADDAPHGAWEFNFVGGGVHWHLPPAGYITSVADEVARIDGGIVEAHAAAAAAERAQAEASMFLA